MKPHPSGRPIRYREIKRYTVPRMQEDGYINPRLRPQDAIVNAIGFTAHLLGQPEQEQDHGES